MIEAFKAFGRGVRGVLRGIRTNVWFISLLSSAALLGSHVVGLGVTEETFAGVTIAMGGAYSTLLGMDAQANGGRVKFSWNSSFVGVVMIGTLLFGHYIGIPVPKAVFASALAVVAGGLALVLPNDGEAKK